MLLLRSVVLVCRHERSHSVLAARFLHTPTPSRALASRPLPTSAVTTKSRLLAAAVTAPESHGITLHTSAAAAAQQMVDTPYGEKVPSKRAHWNTERILATSLIGVIPLSLMYPSFPMDMLLSTGVLLHAHWGVVAVGSDYGKYLPGPLPKAVGPAIHTASAVAFACLCYFNYYDVGVAMAIKTFWTLG